MLLLTFLVEDFDSDGSVTKSSTRSFCSELRLNEALMVLHRDRAMTFENFTLLSVKEVDFISHANRTIFNVPRIEEWSIKWNLSF